jgi:hypothetical protein
MDNFINKFLKASISSRRVKNDRLAANIDVNNLFAKVLIFSMILSIRDL